MIRTILFFVLVVSMYSCAQDVEVLYKFGYIPISIYEMELIQVSENKLEYTGSEEFMKKLQQQGVENPSFIIDSIFTKTILTTGKLDNDKFPVQMEFIDEYRSDGRVTAPIGTKIYGIVLKDSFPVMDSIASDNMSEIKKKTIIDVMNTTMSQLNVTPRKISVGTMFTEEQVIKIPIDEFVIEMLATSKYNVYDISDNRAFMDIVTDYDLIFNSEMPFKSTASGSGVGKIIYDISNTFYEKYVMENSMEIMVEMEHFTLRINTNSFYSQNNIITNKN